MRISNLRYAIVVVVALFAGGFVRPASASDWSVGVGGDLVGSYAYNRFSIPSGDFAERFGSTGSLTGAVSRRLPGDLWVRLEAGSMTFSRELPLASGGIEPAAARLEERVVPVSLGLRWSPALPVDSRTHPYVEAAPSVYLTRWTERRTNPDGSTSFRAALGGWAAGGGFAFDVTDRVGLDLRVRYLWSRNVGQRTLGFTSGELEGLRQMAFGFALNLGL